MTDGQQANDSYEPDTAGPALPRRRLLAGAAAAGALGLASAGPAVAQQPPPRDRERPPAGRDRWAAVDHTHDGDDLGVEEPVASMDVDALRTTRHPYVDVEAFGAAGDGETDDAPAIQAAIDSLDSEQPGVLVFGAGKPYHIASTVRVDVARVRGIEGNNARIVTDRHCLPARGGIP